MEIAMTEEPGRKRRAGGRAGMKIRAGTAVIDQMPWRIPGQPRPPDRAAGRRRRAAHPQGRHAHPEATSASRFLNPEAVRNPPQGAGCKVNGHQRSGMDEDFVMEMVRRAPSSFTITPRNPDREIVIGGKHMLFVNVSSPPNAWDLERGKRISAISRPSRNS
jgi:trimethylamine--corrinoid protein Co-methyltransferase